MERSIRIFLCAFAPLREKLLLVLLTLAFLAVAPPSSAQQVVDKMVATVNAGVRTDLITYSDLLWQLALQPPLQPLLGLAVLALGAMAVAAGGRAHMRMATVLALVADRAIGLGAALADGLDDLVVLGGDVLAEARQVLRPEAMEELLDGTQLTALPSAC